MAEPALTTDFALDGATGAPAASSRSNRMRLESIDVVRGAIMVIMALDHTREFFATPGQNPTDLATTTVGLFLTRWVTHVCAPVFFLLTGTGAYLARRRRSPRELSRFLLTRGLWLIFLELGLVRCFAYQFNVDYRVTMLLVLWALGWAMIVLSVLIRMPAWVVTASGVLLIAGHNLLDSVRSANPLWSILHSPGFVLNTPEHVVFVAYPLIPWIGVTAVGYGLGQIYAWDTERRRAWLLRLGLVLSLGFLVIRALNTYGDPARWLPQKTAAFTLLSFLNTTKYPPSLVFLLMTLGPALIFLWAVDRADAANLAAGARDREGATVLLRVALCAHPLARRRDLLPAIWFRALDVRVAGPRALSVHRAARLGIFAACCVFGVGVRGRHNVSALPMVRVAQGAAKRCVAELHLRSLG